MGAFRLIAPLGAVFAAFLMVGGAKASPADLDTTFATGGAITIPIDGFAVPPGRLATLQPDGKLLVVATTDQIRPGLMPAVKRTWLILRYTAEGIPDPSFGMNGSTTLSISDGTEDDPSGGIALLPDGRFLVAGESVVPNCRDCFYGNTLGIVARFNADGSLDHSFGSNGIFTGPSGFNSIALENDGKVIVGGNASFVGFQLARLTIDGAPDPSFVSNIACPFGATGAFRIAHDGKILIVAQYPILGGHGFCVSRLNSDGTSDTTFGTQGVALLEPGMDATPGDSFFVDPAGAVTIAGTVTIGLASGPKMSGKLVRLTPSGATDLSFGVGGYVPNGAFDGITAVAGDCASRTIAAGPSNSGGGSFVTARFWPDGTIDTTFTRTSSGLAQTDVSAGPRQLLLRPDGRILVLAVAGNVLSVVQYEGDQSCPANVVTVAVEYYYSDWNYYFVTAFQEEIATLDGGAFGGVWKRTGETFNVWPQPNPSASPTCRFFSIAFAPKSSHFYTPFPVECAGVKGSADWRFEGVVFYVEIPAGFGTGNGSCPVGTVALYRAYNNGMGGAPNHRYTTNLVTLNTMLAQGWTFEGELNTEVFACVPQ
jgi:uncharacterized delta-60 repeat protein